jgi:hypothetical protein
LSKPNPFHLELFTELLVLFLAVYTLFGPLLMGSAAIPTMVLQVLAGAYMVIRFVLPNLPAAFQVNKAEGDLQTTLLQLSAAAAAHDSQISAIAKQLADLTPQQTQTTSSTQPTNLNVSGGTA